jgi:hypothetical protein
LARNAERREGVGAYFAEQLLLTGSLVALTGYTICQNKTLRPWHLHGALGVKKNHHALSHFVTSLELHCGNGQLSCSAALNGQSPEAARAARRKRAA